MPDLHINNKGLYTRTVYTVAGLPPVAVNQGEIYYISDCTDIAFGNYGKIATGGGFNKTRVQSDGVNYRIASYGDDI